jgi:hypothetical protein
LGVEIKSKNLIATPCNNSSSSLTTSRVGETTYPKKKYNFVFQNKSGSG